jgi:hypothetical protein
MDRKKELKEEYRRMKPAMGVFSIQSKITRKYYLEGTTDLKARMNRTVFQLNFGSHPNRELQMDWQKWGQENFTLNIIDELPYAEDLTAKDYQDEVLELQSIWEEKLRLEGADFY